MMPGALRSFRLLLADAFADALRRRLVLVVAIVTLLLVSTIETCTGGTVIQMNGREVDLAPYLAPGLFGFLACGVMLVAGILAADHLARPVRDRSAQLWLARPVSRSGYAVARLAGVLGIALALEGMLLGTAAVLSHLRSDLPLGPALLGGIACAAGVVVVASLAMAASLVVPRIAAVLLVMVIVPWLLLVNGLALLGVEYESSILLAVQGFGPPLGTAVLQAVLPWISQMESPGGGLEVALRLATWTVLAPIVLLATFRRLEL